LVQSKILHEVTNWLVTEKVYKPSCHASRAAAGRRWMLVHAARVNIRTHLPILVTCGQPEMARRVRLSHADPTAAAAHLSCVDFLGDVPWEENEQQTHSTPS
jgi:glutathione S-transferase